MWADLPRRMRVQILKRCPAKSLIRYRIISKSCYNLISSSDFIAAYTEHATQVYKESAKSITPVIFSHSYDPVFPVHSDNIDGSFNRSRYINLPDPPLMLKIACSCNGLLLCFAKTEYDGVPFFVLWNPSIGEYLDIHTPAREGSGGDLKFLIGFGYDRKTRDYKILRIGYRDRWSDDASYRPETEVSEVYDLSTGVWRTIGAALPAYYFESTYPFAAFLNGSLHWVGYGPARANGVSDRILVSFDVSGETFGGSQMPEMNFPPAVAATKSVPFAECSYLMIAPGEVLAMVEVRMQRVDHDQVKFEDKNCSVWAMMEYGDASSWTIMYNVDLSEKGRPIHLRNNGDIIMTRKGMVVSYDAWNVKWERLRTLFYPRACYVCPYMESLVLLDIGIEDDVFSECGSSATPREDKIENAEEQD